MTREDVDDLFALLELYCPRDRRLKEGKWKNLWFQTLEPYSREAVKAAVLGHFREHNFLPTASELCMRCPPLPGTQGTEERKKRERGGAEGFQRRWMEQLEREGHPPSLAAAREQGMDPEQWWRLWGRRQLEDGEWTARLSQRQRERLQEEVNRQR